MDLKVLAKAQLSVFKNGLLLAFVLVLAGYSLIWIWGVRALLDFNYGCNPFQMALVNFIFKLAIFLS